MAEISAAELRNACGLFATGVAIVTTADKASAQPAGMTVNSFASVSLEPPLVLWSVARSAPEYEIFCGSDHHAIHILHSGQQELSNRFAAESADKFNDVEWLTGSVGSPLLTDYLVCLQCTTEHRYSGGDHSILVGRVVEITVAGGEQPLLFHAGAYQELAGSF